MVQATVLASADDQVLRLLGLGTSRGDSRREEERMCRRPAMDSATAAHNPFLEVCLL